MQARELKSGIRAASSAEGARVEEKEDILVGFCAGAWVRERKLGTGLFKTRWGKYDIGGGERYTLREMIY